MPQVIDDTVLMSRHNRQKRPNGRYLRAKCGQTYNPSGQRADPCGISPAPISFHPRFVQQVAAQMPQNSERAVYGEQIVATLWRQLSWSHFRELLPLTQPFQREF